MCSGPGVVVQVNHGVVGRATAAKGSAGARLSVPQTLQVALRRTTHIEMNEVHEKRRGRHETFFMASLCTAHAILGDTDRCQ